MRTPVRFRIRLFPIIAFLSASVITQPRAETAPSSSTLANEIVKRIGAVTSRENTFHETRTLAALSKKLESSGILRWRAPDYLEKLTLAPRREDLVISGHDVMLTRGNTATNRLDISSSHALQVLTDTLRAPLSGDNALLAREYHLSAQEDGKGLWTLTLIPATEDTAKYVRKVVIKGKLNAITDLEIEQENGDLQSISIAL